MLRTPVSREDFRTIWDAFNEHQVRVFRNQAFDDASQNAFSRNFVELEMMIAHPTNDWNSGHISALTNLGVDGNRLPLDHPAMRHHMRNEAGAQRQFVQACSGAGVAAGGAHRATGGRQH